MVKEKGSVTLTSSWHGELESKWLLTQARKLGEQKIHVTPSLRVKGGREDEV